MFNNFFNLKINPFFETPNLDFYFESQSHVFSLQNILTSLYHGHGFVTLSGEVGTGKTILSRMLVDLLSKQSDCALILQPVFEDLELLQIINEEFNITTNNSESKTTHLTNLYDFLIENNKKNKMSVLIIDEAQNLTHKALETIRMVSNLEGENKKLIQIIFIGQPELLTNLSLYENRQLAQRISRIIKLLPLKVDEIGPYIFHRIELAGGNNFIRFDQKAIYQIYQWTKGVPRLIHLICLIILEYATESKQRQIDHKIVKECMKMVPFQKNYIAESS